MLLGEAQLGQVDQTGVEMGRLITLTRTGAAGAGPRTWAFPQGRSGRRRASTAESWSLGAPVQPGAIAEASAATQAASPGPMESRTIAAIANAAPGAHRPRGFEAWLGRGVRRATKGRGRAGAATSADIGEPQAAQAPAEAAAVALPASRRLQTPPALFIHRRFHSRNRGWFREVH
jgi:hypothetical protein